VAAFRFIKDGKKIQSFHGFSTRYGKVKKYRITYVDDAVIRGASPDAPELINQQAIGIISNSLPENKGPSAELLKAKEDRAYNPETQEEKRSVLTRLNSGRYPASLQDANSVSQTGDVHNGESAAEGAGNSIFRNQIQKERISRGRP
jgi:hypothetical protein